MDGLGTADPEIDTVLAAHVASIAYASYERRVRQLIAERCRHPTDDPINRFTEVASVRLVRSIKVGELAGFLGFFGETEKQAFQRAIDAQPEAVAAWGNLLTGRHGVAHELESAPTMTLADVKRDIAAAAKVLEAFEAALGESQSA